MKKIALLLFLLFSIHPAFGQTTATGRIVVATSTTLPAICSAGDVATATDNYTLYECGPANTWTAVGTSGATTWVTLTGGTNTSSAFVCGTGCSISATGSGTNTATNGLNSVTNDTNVTGTLTGEVLTLGWTSTLAVTRGGIGVGTLTGIAKGNGTSAFTAAVNTDVVGLFTGSCGSTTYLRGDGSCNTPPGTGGAAFDVNGTPLSSATTVNFINSTANSVGLTATFSNPSVGQVKVEIGGSYTGTVSSATNATNATNLVGPGTISGSFSGTWTTGTLTTTAHSSGSFTDTGLSSGFCVQTSTGGLFIAAAGACITPTGSPANGNLTCWSGTLSITGCNLSGEVTTSGSSTTSLASTISTSHTWSASQTFGAQVFNGTVTGTAIQGTDSKLLSSGTVSGTGSTLCTDSLGGATTSGCNAGVTEATWSSSYGSNTGIGGTGYLAKTTLNNAHTITRYTIFLNGAPTSCSTYPVISVVDATTSTTLATLGTSNGNFYYDSGLLSVATTAGDVLGIEVTTASSGCITPATFPTFTVVYK